MLLGLNGLKGSGKDTVGQIFIDKYGFQKLSFAAKLKESAAALLNIDPRSWETWKNDNEFKVVIEWEKKPSYHLAEVSVREFLQRYGTEAHRNIFGQDFWVDHALKGINPNIDYVITDCRFENEIDAVRKLDGFVVRIIRETDEVDNHISEIPPPHHKVDYYLDNDGSLDDLYNSADELYIWLKNGVEYED